MTNLLISIGVGGHLRSKFRLKMSGVSADISLQKMDISGLNLDSKCPTSLLYEFPARVSRYLGVCPSRKIPASRVSLATRKSKACAASRLTGGSYEARPHGQGASDVSN